MLSRQTINVNLPWYIRRFVRTTLGQATRTITQAAKAARNPIEESPLFVADTRPAIFFGIPHVAAVMLIAAFGESIVFLGPIYAFWVVIPAVVTRMAVRKDYNAPRAALLWLMTKAASWDAHYWWGSSPSPFPIRTGKYPRGIC